MTEIASQLIFEILKNIQAAVSEIKSTQSDHTRQLLRIREDVNNVRDDINGLRGDELRIEAHAGEHGFPS